MDNITYALMQGMGTEILEQLAPELPILLGDVIALSNYGQELYEKDEISWASRTTVANFIAEQDAPYLPTAYGTVQIVEEPFPVFARIHREACKVSFNHGHFKKAKYRDMLFNAMQEQLTAKVQAWDRKCAALLLFGNPYRAIPGLLFGSGIPLITSTVNLRTAAADAVIAEVLRLFKFVPSNTENLFKPNLIGIPQDAWDILEARSYSTQDSTSLLKVILERLREIPNYGEIKVTPVPQFNSNKIMTILPDDPNYIGGAIWNLEEFDSPDNSEQNNDGKLASAHEGGVAGVVAKRANSGVVVTLTY